MLLPASDSQNACCTCAALLTSEQYFMVMFPYDWHQTILTTSYIIMHIYNIILEVVVPVQALSGGIRVLQSLGVRYSSLH